MVSLHDFSMVVIGRMTRERVAELDGTWWDKACEKSHRFAQHSIIADDIQFNEGEEDVDDVSSAEEDDSDAENEVFME